MLRSLTFVVSLLFALLVAPLLSLTAHAHFTVGTDARIIHIAPAANGEGLSLFLRIPGPLAYGEALSQRESPTALVEAPFLTMNMIQGIPFYSIDQVMIRSRIEEFKIFLTKGYAFTLDGVRAAFFPTEEHPEYDSAEGAATAFDTFAKTPPVANPQPIYVADALFDLELFIPTSKVSGELAIQNALPEFLLPPDIVIENLVLDHRFDPPRSLQFRGQMMGPLVLNGSWVASLMNFIWQGIIHILIGLDHVLFVVCLALAAGLSWSILWSVTGFTLGHSITLYLGSVGLAPEGIWFIPAVETAIASSILYAAFLVLLRLRRPSVESTKMRTNLFLIAAIIGLIHGYGFSFVLGDLLGGNANQLVLALVGFNVGVEVGQLGIVLIVFAMLWLTSKIHHKLPRGLSYLGSFVAIAMSVFWCWDRAGFLISLLEG